MKSGLAISDALGVRQVSAADLPLSIGGSNSDLVLNGVVAGPAAYLALHEEQLFVQAAEGADVRHNGAPLGGSAWFQTGDVLSINSARLRLVAGDDKPVLLIEDQASGNATAPPVIVSTAVTGHDLKEDERIAALSFRASASVQAPRRVIRPMQMVLAAVVLVAAAVLWFVFTATSVQVTTTPAQAHLDFRGGWPAIAIGENVLLHPGRYQVQVTHAGYRPLTRDVEIAAARYQELKFELQKLPGRLRIQVPESATVIIDNQGRGAAPGDFELSAGEHQITLQSKRYQDYTAKVQVAGEGKLQTFAPSLVPAWAAVHVTSEPAGAEVLVEGESRGVTPLTTEVIAGTRPLELRLQGFKPWTTDLQVRANTPLSVGPVRLGLPDARLSIKTTPNGASVSVAGVYRGQTPLQLELRPELAQTIAISKAGYTAVTRELTLQPAETRELAVELSGIYGEIDVQAQPSDAQLFIDGEARGSARQKVRLTATEHQLEIRKPGLETYKAVVTPRPGLAQVVTARLTTPEESKFAALPQLLRSKVGLELKLMPSGRYTMGSSRREPGRRANENQRAIELKRPFYVSLHEVTNAQYRQFKPEHRTGFVGSYTLDLDRQPVATVSWQEAAAFCNWLSQQDGLPPAYQEKDGSLVVVTPLTIGYRLPTEAEWEWVARYDDGQHLRRYPWGDALPVAARSGNYADESARPVLSDVVSGYDDGFAAAAPVGSFSPNALGLFDLGGNVSEWTHDYYSIGIESEQTALDPLGPAEGKQHVIRGASWKQSSVAVLRLTVREFGTGPRNDLGFRVARYAQ